MVCLLSNDGIKIRILNTWQLSFIICLFCLFFRNQSEKVSLLIKALINKFSLCWTSFIFIFIIIWTCMNLSLFELYLKFMTVIYFILFYLNLWLNICFLNNFVNIHGICGYMWIWKNRRVPDEYGYEYGTDIYPSRVWRNYYSYPTRPVDIPKNVYLTIIIKIIIIIITIIIIIILNNNNNIIILVL